MPAEPPLSCTLKPNLRYESPCTPRFPFSDGFVFRDSQIRNEPQGWEAASPCLSTCASPTCTRDAVAPLPRHLSLCLQPLVPGCPRLASALLQRLSGIKRCLHVPAKAKGCLHVGGWKELGVQLQGGYCKHRAKLI